MIIFPWDDETNISIKLDFRTFNNEAEYEAFLLGLKAARNLGIFGVVLYSDSQLAIHQRNGKFEVKGKRMLRYDRELEKVKDEFAELTMDLIPHTDNGKTDHLARLASALGECPDPMFLGRELISQLEILDDIIAEVLEKD
ncbi:uncharacterized protein [Henckelia pumila]|uniref:uncharacterized protein n=1 Tax=Henckelia pumila TaxID=405737 RepID=UPI003C6DD86E